MINRKLAALTTKCMLGVALLTGSLFTGSLCAENTESVSLPAQEAHIPVGERAMTLVEKIVLIEQRSANDESAKENATPEERAAEEERISSNAYYSGEYCDHPRAIHKITYKNAGGELVTLEDDSIWKVASRDAATTKSWNSTDNLIIVQNNSFWDSFWTSAYPFRFVNQTQGTSVAVINSQGPKYSSPNTLRITGMDDRFNYIYLNDASVWQIHKDDSAASFDNPIEQYNWFENDAIILGSNNAWFAYKTPYILFNVNSDNYVRATRIQ